MVGWILIKPFSNTQRDGDRKISRVAFHKKSFIMWKSINYSNIYEQREKRLDSVNDTNGIVIQ